MKKLFIVLLLANAVFFGWMQLNERNARAKTELPPLNADKIRLVNPSDSVTQGTQNVEPTKPAPVPSQSLDPAPISDPKPTPALAVPAPKPESTAVCLEWGDFSGTDLTRAVAVLDSLPLTSKPVRREIEQDTGYWVYMPPLRNRAAVNKKIGELKELGISEYFVVTAAGRWHNAISLGVFKTPEAAQAHLDHLRIKGVRTATTGERASKLRMTRFLLNGVTQNVRAALTDVQGDFTGSELKNVPCALTR